MDKDDTLSKEMAKPVIHSYYDYLARRSKLHAAYKADATYLDTQLAVFQKSCAHAKTTFNADPAGNDSWTECDICGASV